MQIAKRTFTCPIGWWWGLSSYLIWFYIVFLFKESSNISWSSASVFTQQPISGPKSVQFTLLVPSEANQTYWNRAEPMGRKAMWLLQLRSGKRHVALQAVNGFFLLLNSFSIVFISYRFRNVTCYIHCVYLLTPLLLQALYCTWINGCETLIKNDLFR